MENKITEVGVLLKSTKNRPVCKLIKIDKLYYIVDIVPNTNFLKSYMYNVNVEAIKKFLINQDNRFLLPNIWDHKKGVLTERPSRINIINTFDKEILEKDVPYGAVKNELTYNSNGFICACKDKLESIFLIP